MIADLLEYGRATAEQRAMMSTPEWDFVAGIGASCFQERPTQSPWQWADDGNVYLDSKMSSEPGPYKSSKTPWTRELQELPLRPEVREAAVMKDSRSGFTEAAFNIVRYMPKHWPGNVGIIYPEEKQGRAVVGRRILGSLVKSAGDRVSQDPNDTTLSKISLTNMEVMIGPSGSARMFTEVWFRLVILDEIEEHSQSDTTTTYDRAKSRQTDVADGLLIAISKPKKAGGPIDLAFIRGSQKKYLCPCPRCGEKIELLRNHFVYDHCQEPDGTWNLKRVKSETFYRCQLCQGRIDETEKPAMTEAGEWTPTPLNERRRPPDGKYIPPQPGVESYQISAYYSNHPRNSWGELMAEYLEAFVINPNIEKQTQFINDKEGLPDEPKLIKIDPASIRAMVAGIVEEKEITAADGTKQKISTTTGIPGGYRLAYRNGQRQAPLPFRPVLLLAKIDKQSSYLKYVVFAVTANAEAFCVDLGSMDDEDAIYHNLLSRPYYSEGHDDPLYITAGYFDSRFRPQDVYKFCLKAYHTKGVNIWPVRGEGLREDQDNSKTEAQYKGRTFRLVEDQCELGKLMVRYFKDAALKAEFYINIVQKRAGIRVWLPSDYPDTLAAELTAERWDEVEQCFVHDKRKHGPNDFGDCFKYIVLWRLENLEAFLAIHSPQSPPPPPDDPPKGRDYILTPPA